MKRGHYEMLESPRLTAAKASADHCGTRLPSIPSAKNIFITRGKMGEEGTEITI